MTAYSRTREVLRTLAARGMDAVTFEDANALRRASLTLSRWAEAECGDSNDYASTGIERDEATGKPWRVVHPHSAPTATRYAIPDREAGALRRIAAICERYGLHYYHQTDPRGAALYVSREPMTDSGYSSQGVAIY